ncbi:MAG: hypothetical protein J2P16_00220 [Mycobacterium sp.]|nr:hypothetical protein [Mycobacterium sp.]
MTIVQRSHDWIGAGTYDKEKDFTGLVTMHISICNGIRRRKGCPTDPPYLYIDLHGGPGRLRDGRGRVFDGSPLIVLPALASAELPHETIHFEREPAVAAELTGAVDSTVYPCTSVINSSFEDGIDQLLASTRPHRYRYGLVYSDPISDPIPVETFNKIAAHYPRVDLLAYVAANNQYKRANANGYGHGRRLDEDVMGVEKELVLIRESDRAEQYTFILFTNWTDMPAWKRRRFHRVEDSGPGREILNRLSRTKREHHEATNEPLPFHREVPYRTYREYLQHPRFKEIRAEVFRRAGGVCERCGLRPPTEPHHLRYPPWGTLDVPENMIAICHQCHCEIHGKAS